MARRGHHLAVAPELASAEGARPDDRSNCVCQSLHKSCRTGAVGLCVTDRQQVGFKSSLNQMPVQLIEPGVVYSLLQPIHTFMPGTGKRSSGIMMVACHLLYAGQVEFMRNTKQTLVSLPNAQVCKHFYEFLPNQVILTVHQPATSEGLFFRRADLNEDGT